MVEELRRLGHDVLTILEAGKAAQAISDLEVLSFATGLSRAVLTLNRKHFIRLHFEQPTYAGIIVCTYDPDFIAQAMRIHEVIASYEQLNGQLLRVNRPN